MRSRSYVLTVLAVLALLVALGMQGCLFGGGGEEAGGETPSGEEGTPAGGEEGAPAGETMGGGEAPAPEGEGAPPSEMMGGDAGAPPEGGGEMPMGGEAPMGEAAGGGATDEALQTKRAGDWDAAQQQLEQILAANPNDAEAHRILGWILVDDSPAEATQHFNAYLQSGAQGEKAEEVKAALERLAAR